MSAKRFVYTKISSLSTTDTLNDTDKLLVTSTTSKTITWNKLKTIINSLITTITTPISTKVDKNTLAISNLTNRNNIKFATVGGKKGVNNETITVPKNSYILSVQNADSYAGGNVGSFKRLSATTCFVEYSSQSVNGATLMVLYI